MLVFAPLVLLLAHCVLAWTLPRDPGGWKLKYLVAEKQIQIQNRLLMQHGIVPRFTPSDRVFFACFAKVFDQVKGSFSLMKPKTMMNWYHDLVARLWTHPSGPRGRRPVGQRIKDLVLAIKKANVLFGLSRIQGELAKLDINLGRTTIQRILHEYRSNGSLQPLGTWKQFLKAHWDSLFACDFFTVDGALGQRWYVFFLVELRSRRIVQWGISQNPTINFLRQMWLQFTEGHRGPCHVIHDHGPELVHFPYQEYGVTGHPTCIASPNLNAYAERFVRSIRRECLDHFIFVGERQLRNVVRQYVDYYNERRPHQGLSNALPSGKPPDGEGTIRSRSTLFGLVRDFYRSA